MHFYLKINRNIPYAYKCIKKWIDIISKIDNSQIHIVCDVADIVQRIQDESDKEKNLIFLKSERNNEILRGIVPQITDKVWEKAGYAHLTAILKGMESGEDYFWNIDADDTMFCACNEEIIKILNLAEKIVRGVE